MALAIDDGRTHPATSSKSSTSIEYRLIFWPSVIVFLCAGLVESILPHNLAARLAGNGKAKSVIQRAKDSANTCAAYAFMG